MKFLGRAKRFLKELSAEPSGKIQYFNVTCGSGHRVRGERTEGYQALRCPACGEGVFVLPRSPLPEPLAPARSGRSGGARRARGPIDDGPVELTDPGRAALQLADDQTGASDAEIIWDDAPEAEHPPDHPRGKGQPANAGSGKGGESDDFWEDDVNRAATARRHEVPEGRRSPGAATQGPVSKAPRERTEKPAGNVPGSQPRRTRKPVEVPTIEIPPKRKRPAMLTAALIAVPLIVLTAVVWQFRQSVRKKYPLIAEAGRLEGIPALKNGDFVKAYQLLAAAKGAVDGLGGEVEGADEIRHAAEEAEIFVNFCSQPLEEMLDEAGRTDPALWASKFDSLYKGRTILIDSTITEVPEPGALSGYALEYVIVPAGGTTNFANLNDARPDLYGFIDLEGFELFKQPPLRKGDHVTFGAKLASFKLEGKVCRVGLEPKSGVYITISEALQSIGFPGGGRVELPIEP